MAMTSRELIRWSQRHDRRARSVPLVVVPVVVGAALAAWVAWRESAGDAAASHAWLAGALVMYAVGFLRVPQHLYWRPDAALLAQLPIDGRALFDAALVRCIRAAAMTTLAALIGAVPLALGDGGVALAARHAAFAGALGAAQALLLPAVSLGAATLVRGGADQALRMATALGGAPSRAPGRTGASAGPSAAPPPAPPAASPGAILGALPGFAATIVFVAALIVQPWLVGGAPPVSGPGMLAAIAAVSAAAVLGARAGAAIMALVLRDVSALDRQRLATLEIKPPTPIERVIARLIGAAALPYGQIARLMRRRFPLAFALGGLVFLILVVVGLTRPVDAMPWLTAAIGGAAAYGVALAGRLRRPPIELARLSATLPLTEGARRTARFAWLFGWWSIFAGAPAVFAALRQSEPGIGLCLTVAATAVMIVAGALPR